MDVPSGVGATQWCGRMNLKLTVSGQSTCVPPVWLAVAMYRYTSSSHDRFSTAAPEGTLVRLPAAARPRPSMKSKTCPLSPLISESW